LLGQRLSLFHYRRHCAAWNELTPRVWIGSKLSQGEAMEIKRRGVTAVLDLTAEFSETPALLDLAYLNIPILDLTGLDPAQLKAAVDFITRQSDHGVVYIHCKAGYSRTAAVAGALLIASGQATTADEAVAALKRARPTIIIRPEAHTALAQFSGVWKAEQKSRGFPVA
jgi:protein phosphatase